MHLLQTSSAYILKSTESNFQNALMFQQMFCLQNGAPSQKWVPKCNCLHQQMVERHHSLIASIICFLQRSPALTAERWWPEDSMEGRLPPTLTSHPTNLTNAATAATLLLMLLLEPIH